MICEKEKCTGCGACYNICSKHCILMKEDEFGYIRPLIDEEKCIHCNLCRKICPANNESKMTRADEAFAVWNLNEEDRKDSASGGIATVLSRYIIKNNGVVFGCMVDEKLNIVHGYAEDQLDIDKFKGSKYVQSYIGQTYKKVKEFLLDEKKVIFFGTPCQVDGLKFYLGKEYENLITADLICHGTPPQKYLKEHIDKITRKIKKTATNVRFRGRNNFMFALFSDDEIIYKKSNEFDFYFRGFMDQLYFREICYSCKYATSNRVSDITIGDFWGIGKDKAFDKRGVDRISVALPNTEKGKAIFNECKAQLFYEKRSLNEAIQGNENLQRPSKKHVKYDKFRKLYLTHGFEKAAKSCLSNAILKDLIKNKKKRIKKAIKKSVKKAISYL